MSLPRNSSPHWPNPPSARPFPNVSAPCLLTHPFSISLRTLSKCYRALLSEKQVLQARVDELFGNDHGRVIRELHFLIGLKEQWVGLSLREVKGGGREEVWLGSEVWLQALSPFLTLSSTMTVPPTVASMTRFKGQFVYILFDLLYLQTAQKESPFLGRPTRFFDRS